MPVRAYHKPRSESAFTLVELTVVIVLVAILSALILPEMAGTYADAKLKSTARRLLALCSFASSQAVSYNQTQRIRFDQTTRQFRLLAASRSDEGTKNRRSSTPGDIETQGQWDPSIRLRIQDAAGAPSPDQTDTHDSPSARGSAKSPTSGTKEGNVLVFFADGTALARQVSLEDEGGFRLILDINALTSRVRIADTRRP